MNSLSNGHDPEISNECFKEAIEERKLKIGVTLNEFSTCRLASMLKCNCIEKLYGVDSVSVKTTSRDSEDTKRKRIDEFFLALNQKKQVFSGKYRQIRKPSKDAAKEISSRIDFLYINADYAENGIWEELCDWFSIVRDGGIIGGNGYNEPHLPDVKQNIDEFFRRFAWDIHYNEKHTWWVIKKKLHISFFMPAYNCENTVHEAVESIMSDNFQKNDELVIVDDASSDNTLKILKELESEFSGIRVLRHNHNRGGGAARNTAVDNCRNPILFCLDSDNILGNGSISRLKKFLKDTGADIAVFQELHQFKNDKKEVNQKWVFTPGLKSIKHHLSTITVPGASGNYMFTKESWIRAKGYPEFAGALDTWGFGLRQVMSGSKMYVMPDTFYSHRIGYESYWIREAGPGSEKVTSMKALQILMPFLHMIDERDIDYLLSRKGRYEWFFNLSKRPIHLAGEKHYERPMERLKQDFSKLIDKIKNKLSVR